ncbi:MAG: arginase family protein [Acidobacteriota bacterium]|jgi:arginase
MKVRVLGVPSSWGTTGPGARRTPAALRNAGIIDWLTEAGLAVDDGGDVPVAPQDEDDHPGAEQVARVADVSRAVRKAAEVTLTDGRLPLLIGGECSLAIGAVAALAAQRGPLTIAWFDAHGDCNTPETSKSALVTGMPLAVALGRGHPQLTAIGAGAPRPDGAATFLIGGRDLDPGEVTNIMELGVRHLDTTTARAAGPEEVAMKVLGVPEIAVMPPEARAMMSAADPSAAAALSAAPHPNVYLHFDVDVIDPDYAPGVYFGVPGGFDPSEIATLAGYLCAGGCVGALSIASANLDNEVEGRTLAAIRDVVTSIADALSYIE